jgi:hypothetical protein
MSNLKLCQGPDCHTYTTKDRLKGMQGSKTYQTRRRSRLYYGEFCDTRCYNDWFSKYGTQAVNHFGRLKEVKHLTEQNAWTKEQNYYTWQRENGEPRYYYHNGVTKEQRPLTEIQYNDINYTINTGE